MEKFTLQVLRTCAEQSYVSLTQLTFALKNSDLKIAESIHALRQLGYIEIDPDHRLIHDLSVDSPIDANTPLKVTISGKSFLEYVNDNEKNRMLNDIRAWITLAVTVLTLLISLLDFFFK